jgi:hypothetical protein
MVDKDLEGDRLGLFQGTVPALAWMGMKSTKSLKPTVYITIECVA